MKAGDGVSSVDEIEGEKETTGRKGSRGEGWRERMTFRGNLCNQRSGDDGRRPIVWFPGRNDPRTRHCLCLFARGECAADDYASASPSSDN